MEQQLQCMEREDDTRGETLETGLHFNKTTYLLDTAYQTAIFSQNRKIGL